MALLTLELFSRVLGKHTTVRVLVNDRAKPPFASWYLLHGLSDDSGSWTRFSHLERYARDWPFLIVMPDGARSFYCDSPLGPYESYLVKDLVPEIDRTFRTRKQAQYRAIGGLSMGGYGSTKCGLKYPQVFGAVAAHSGALYVAHKPPEYAREIPEVQTLLETVDPEQNSCFVLARNCPAHKRPHLYFDCGRDDFLYHENNEFHRHLKTLGFPHTYKRFPGAHNWDYWDAHVQNAARFLMDAMGLGVVE